MTDNKTIVCIGILAIISFSSCGPPVNQRLTNYHYMINPTGKRIIHELTFGVPNEYRDSTLSYYSNGTNTREELEWKVSYVVGVGPHSQAAIDYKAPFYFYNIDDTTVLYRDKYWNDHEDYIKIFTPFHLWSEPIICNDEECDHIAKIYLTISDSLLSLMRKDYTMLDKFSEYYTK